MAVSEHLLTTCAWDATVSLGLVFFSFFRPSHLIVRLHSEFNHPATFQALSSAALFPQRNPFVIVLFRKHERPRKPPSVPLDEDISLQDVSPTDHLPGKAGGRRQHTFECCIAGNLKVTPETALSSTQQIFRHNPLYLSTTAIIR